MQPRIINARNVNDALGTALAIFEEGRIRRQACRPNAAGSTTLEHEGLVVTHYTHPRERVLFSPRRNANPFFHFFEALWILAGSNDARWLAHFNKRMLDFADNGRTFHGAYGYRLRQPYDQIRWAISTLNADPDTRRCVLTIYNSEADQTVRSKDIPCNLALDFLIRDEALHLTVFNRSNDMIWGAYGANMVQFSTILEFVADALKIPVGTYTQVSNSFHVYEEEPTWQRMSTFEYDGVDLYNVTYSTPVLLDAPIGGVTPYSLMHGLDRSLPPMARAASWMTALTRFMDETEACMLDGSLIGDNDMEYPYFSQVAVPLFDAWQFYKATKIHEAIQRADECKAKDWRIAAVSWLRRTNIARTARVPV